MMQDQSLRATAQSDTMHALARLTDAVSAVVPPGAKIGYLDYPMHLNIGDLLIQLGTMDFFAANANAIPVAFSIHDARERAWRALEEVDVIVCHGGGNFGDIYHPHQALREEAVRRFPQKPVVVMPQSIHFGSDHAMRQSAAVFRKHDNLTILVRDEDSYNLARAHFTDQVTRMPDMAHRLFDAFGAIRANQERQLGTLSLMRRDVEASIDQSATASSVDWRDLLSVPEKVSIGRHRAIAIMAGLINAPASSPILAYNRTVEVRVRRLAFRLVNYDHWVTSRLHGAILANLLGKRVTAYDNSYGKLKKYFAAWGDDLATVL